ncbi:MAG: hypothetical protein HY905_11695 [Deltaproteobacteria bacterium]|nr:hypothetical protein [Deltaproteobacteria bacterium]
MDAPAEPARSALDEIGARYCAHAGIGHYAPVPGVDAIGFEFLGDDGYFAGPCPWQIAAEVGELLPVRDIDLDEYPLDYLFGCAPCCETDPWTWGCYPVPP